MSSLPNLYVPTDSHDQLVWTLNEGGTGPWVNSGQLGALSLAVHSAAGPAATTGLYGNGVNIPQTAVAQGKYIDTGAAGTSLGEYTAAMSLSCFVYPTLKTNSYYQVIIQKAYRPDASGSTAPFSGIELYIAPSATVMILGGVITVAGAQHGVESTSTLVLNQWNHIGVTYDGVNVTLYCNGVQVGQLAQTGAIDFGTHGAWQVGNDVGFGAPYQGNIDDIRVADIARPLSYYQQFGGQQTVSVQNMSPSPTAIAAQQSIAFDVLATSPTGIASSLVFANYPASGLKELIHDGTGFNLNYQRYGTFAGVTGGYHYSVLRDGGWPSTPVQLQVFAADFGGDETT